ncbi:MAG: TonB-dependent receptor [Acidobacteria bacterium]|nr:TonB-dependent receptor [Acidobacteriota bacterium]
MNNLQGGNPRERLFAGLLILSLLFVAPGFAQERWGKILGNVTDPSGAVVPEARIVATSPTTPQPLETTTDGLGNYVLPVVPIGLYTVEVSKTGFQTVRQANLEVKLGAQVIYNAKLAVGQVAEVVEVTSGGVLLETTSSRTSTNISESQFDNLPKGRTFNSLLAMAPGVRAEVKAGNAGVGGFQVDGASGSENAYIIDGVDVSDVRRGSLRQQNAIPFEFVQEIQIKSGGFEAEYGGATGGVVNVATRAGTNQFHGQANFQFTNDGTNAGDRGFWQRSPLNADRADFFRPPEDSYHIYYPGISIGGPIIKNRLYFFGSYMPELEHTDRTINYTAGARTFGQTQRRHYGLGRVDFAPTSRLQFNSSYLWSPWKVNGLLQNRDTRIAAPTNDLSVQGGFQPAQAYTASATYSATAHLLLSARYGYRYLNDKLGNYGLSGAPYLIYQTASSAAQGVPSEFAGGTGFRNVSSTFGTVRDITTRHNVYVDGTYIANIKGQQHTLKVGYAINRVSNDVENNYTNGQFDIFWGDSFTRGSITNARGTYGYYVWQDGVRLNSAVHGRNQGLYFQDAWRIHPRLSLNVGVRFENEFLPPYVQEVGGKKVANPVAFGWGDKVAPRLGAAWDVTGDGKWKVSGSFGFFYDVMKYELARGSFGGDYWFSHVYRLNSPAVTTLSKTNPAVLGPEIISYDNRTVPINARGELDGLDPNLKPYTSREFSVTVEHQFASRLVGAIRYTRKDLLKAIEDIGVLDAEDNEVYLIGNPGFGETRNTKTVYGQKTTNGQEFLVPRAVRNYDGLEFRLQGRVNRFEILGSYTYSRLYGNYSGTANSDESGRSDPGVSRAFDLPYYYFDASGSQKNVLGPLGTDRPHTFKLFGTYELKTKAGSTFFGLTQVAYSGTPDSTTVIYQSAPTFPYGRGDLGRTPVFTQTDLGIHHSVKLRERATLKFEADIRNLFNQAAVISRVTQINRASAISEARLPVNKFFAGYKLSDFVFPGSTVPPYNPIYGLPGASYRAGSGPVNGALVTGLGSVGSAWSAANPNFGAYQEFRVIRLGIRLIF